LPAACQFGYEKNFGERPFGDITKVDEKIFPTMTFYLQGSRANHLVL